MVKSASHFNMKIFNLNLNLIKFCYKYEYKIAMDLVKAQLKRRTRKKHET